MGRAPADPLLTIRLYFDQDSLDSRLVAALREQGVDVLTSPEAHLERASDPEHLAFAAREGRALYTANLPDFARLHAEWMREGRSHCGIIVRVQQQLPVGAQIRAMSAVVEARPQEERDWFVYLDNWLPTD